LERLLIIDDDPDIRTLLKHLLEKNNYKVETASGEAEAMSILESEKPSLILLDVLLSGTDGRELCKRIKNSPGTAGIPVIIFSGHPGASLRLESYGADDFLPKPLNSEVVWKKIRERLKDGKKETPLS
jgi:CheY-like chemotaxis protein